MTYTITPLIGEEAIRARVKELAASIDAAMAGRPYILLLLLNGALPFATMLKGHLKSRPVVKTVKITSYAGMENSGSVAWDGDCGPFRPDVPVLVVDEAISQHQSEELESEPWHLYQTTLFAMYVDYDNGKVRLSAALACHDADLEISLKDFVEILGREAAKEADPLHYTPGAPSKCIHRYRNPYFKRRRQEREPDIGFYS